MEPGRNTVAGTGAQETVAAPFAVARTGAAVRGILGRSKTSGMTGSAGR